MEHIRIDVAIPNYNSPFLAETIESVLNQEDGLFDLNIYVVDDGSKPELITNVQKSYEAKGIAFYSNEQNLGLVGNFNRCLELAKADYIHILHADDMVDPSFYRRVAQEIKQLPSIALIASSSRTYDGKNFIQNPILDLNVKGIFEHLKYRNCLVASTVVLKTNVAKELKFRNYAPHACDWDMWARITVNRPSVYITDTLHTYRDHDTNDTGNYSDIAILKVDLLLQKQLIKDGIFTQEGSHIGKDGIANSAKYRIAGLVLNGKIGSAISVLFFLSKELGLTYSLKAKIGALKVVLSRLKHSLFL